ncbi:MAG: hypothetical protein SVS85_03055 [Candidatus Nanohaloarchaea archaeon]|nr:hypothetical protein [Candidatus Nanohaloarchaea archaeon]
MERPHEIDGFEDYVERGEVRDSETDPSKAESMKKRATSKFENMERLGVDEETATDYVENVYEAAKLLVQSFMARDGHRPYSHEAVIAYAVDELEVGMVDANRFNRYRKLRNDIAYRGEVATVKEAEDIRELFKSLRSELVNGQG